MKIKKLIEAFELAIPTYQQAVDEKWDYRKLAIRDMEKGLCFYMVNQLDIYISNAIWGYYEHFLDSRGYLFSVSNSFQTAEENIKEAILPRLNFMKSEVKDLKRLMKKGYTHV